MKFYYLGTFDQNGKSQYINSNPSADPWINDVLPLISPLYPEGYKLHHTHPEWLRDNTIDVLGDTEIVLTFVDEGAGYRNAVGYFIYPTANPPKSIDYIRECYFFFPNASKSGSGGSLVAGDRIKLPFTFNYSSANGKDYVTPNNYTFQNGHSVGFILFPNAWNGSGVNEYVVPYTSISSLNPEKAPELRFHTACYQIPGTERLVMGFEDLRRDTSSCDHDFNDILMIIDLNLSSISKKFTNTVELEDEKNDPNIPKNYVLGYKKIFTKIGNDVVEAVVTMYIPRSSTIKKKKGYSVRMMTDNAYVKSIVVVAPKTVLANTTRHVGVNVTSGYSWFKNEFIYTVGSYVTETLDTELMTGIHYFGDFSEAAGYDFTPTYLN